MHKIALPFLLMPLAACSGADSQHMAISACETAVTTMIDTSGNIEKLTIENERVHAFIEGKNGRGDTIYKDLYCVFKLDRELTEREATYKLKAFAEDNIDQEFGVGVVDSHLAKAGKPTVSDTLRERGFDALKPEESGLTPA